MRQVIVDGENIRSELEFHQVISKQFDFPDYYGENLDALWDCLTDDVPQNTLLIWKNHDISKAALRDDFDDIVSVFKELEAKDPTFQIKLQ